MTGHPRVWQGGWLCGTGVRDRRGQWELLGYKSPCWATNLLAGPPRGRVAHDIYVGDLSAMQFNIPRLSRVCVYVCVSAWPPPHATLCHPHAHLLTCGLPGSISCPPTALFPCLHPGRTGLAPQGARARWGVLSLRDAPGTGHRPCPPELRRGSGVPGRCSVVPGKGCQVDWSCQPCASPQGRGSQGPPYPASPPAGMR